jgi:hypothetical protein
LKLRLALLVPSLAAYGASTLAVKTIVAVAQAIAWARRDQLTNGAA